MEKYIVIFAETNFTLLILVILQENQKIPIVFMLEGNVNERKYD